MCNSILSEQKQQMCDQRRRSEKAKKSRHAGNLLLLLQTDSVFWTQLNIPPLSAGVKYRKLLLYNSESFFFSAPVCVDDFKLYLFFMAICMFKELLQEYLKRQEHLRSRARFMTE